MTGNSNPRENFLDLVRAHELEDEEYPSGQVILNCRSRPWMLVSTNNCVDTWTLHNPIQA